MLNILKQKIKSKDIYDNILNKLIKKEDLKKDLNVMMLRGYPANQEWNNNIYQYNNNNIKPIITKTNIINRLIKDYFNLTFFSKEIKSRKRRILFKRKSTKRIFVSKAAIKHTNNKIYITIFSYNREKTFLLHKINQILKIKKTIFNKNYLRNKLIIKFIFKILQDLRLKKAKQIIYYNNKLLKIKIKKENKLLFKIIKWKNINLLRSSFIEKYEKISRLDNLYLFYIKILLLNNYKFKQFFILHLKTLISKIYDKKIELKIINLKNLCLNSDIYLQAIATKLNIRKNTALNVLNKALSIGQIKRVTIHKWKNIKLLDSRFKSKNLDSIYNYWNNDILDLFLNNTFIIKNINYYNLINANTLKKYILYLLNYKKISGVKFKARGRLTRRLTASRSLQKKRYRGNIKNIYSTYINLSTPLLKGYTRSNIQYTLINYKTRNGSFGVRGWVSSY